MTFDPDHSGIELWPLLSIPGLLPVLVPAMPALSVCTVSAAEMSDRTAHGEDGWDIIEEHTSWIWFRNRDGYEIARRIARGVLSGRVHLAGAPVGIGALCPMVDGAVAPIIVQASAHHVRQPDPPSQSGKVCELDHEYLVARRQMLRARIGRNAAQPTWRAVPRACIPGRLINRAVQAAINPLVLAGPELVKWLEPHVAQLSGMTSPSRRQRWLLAAALWLLEEPDTEQQQTASTDPDPSSLRDADLSLSAPLQEKQAPQEAGRCRPSRIDALLGDLVPPLGPSTDASAPQVNTGRGVR